MTLPVIGISLINYTGNKQEYRNRLIRMMDSLFKSDLVKYLFVFSILENGSNNEGMMLSFSLALKYQEKCRDDQKIYWNMYRDGLGIIFSRNYTFYRILAEQKVDYMLELHNDMIFPEVWLEPLVTFMENNLEYAVISPNIFNSTSVKFENVTESDFKRKTIGITKYIANHPDLIRMKYLDQIGYYNENLIGQNWEEVELWYRFSKLGYGIGIHPKSVVYHEKAVTRLELTKFMEDKYKDAGGVRVNLNIISKLHPDFHVYYKKYFSMEDDWVQRWSNR